MGTLRGERLRKEVQNKYVTDTDPLVMHVNEYAMLRPVANSRADKDHSGNYVR